MLNTLFQGVFDNTEYSIQVPNFLLCMAVALIIGIFFSIIYSRNRCSKSFVVTLALLPAVVSVIIMMVNGNVGAGVAVAGAFSLVRFRSVPGSAREIGTLFLAMAAGLICGMGYLGYAVLFSIVMGAAMMLLNQFGFGGTRGSFTEKVLRITIPEDLNYNEIFDDIFAQYTTQCDVLSVKTTNMGSLFRLQYQLTLRDDSKEKEFIDALRCRNGNLEISIARQEAAQYEL
jgi:hypothetical protein